MKKSLFVFGGNAGANIVFEIGKKSYKQIFYTNTYANNIEEAYIKEYEYAVDSIKNKNSDYFVATGDNLMRKEISESLIKLTKKNPTNIISESSIIHTKKIGFGNLITSGAVINIDTDIGNGTIINSNSTVEHGSIIQNYSQLAPGVTLGGRVSIGENTFVGLNSTVLTDISICKNVLIGAHSLVIENISVEGTYVGSPCKKIK